MPPSTCLKRRRREDDLIHSFICSPRAMSHVNVDRKPFPLPVSEIAAATAAYGFGDDGGPSTSPAEVGPTSNLSPPFAVASSLPPPWYRLPQPTPPPHSWYVDGGGRLDHPDCKVRPSVRPGSLSPRFAQPSYGHHRTLDCDAAGGLSLSHLSNGLPHTIRNDSSLPTSCYLSNAGMLHTFIHQNWL